MWAKGRVIIKLERPKSLILLEQIKSMFFALTRLIPETARYLELLSQHQDIFKVLLKLDYVDEDGLCLKPKCRYACEANTVNSKVLTEIMIENMPDSVVTAEITFLRSCLVCRVKNGSEDNGTSSARLCRKLRNCTRTNA